MNDTKVVMSVEDAKAHAAGLGIMVVFEAPDGCTQYAWPDGVVTLKEPELAELQRGSAVHRVGCCCSICYARLLAERGRESALTVKRGTHDWNAQPRVMVDEREGDNPHVFGHLLTLGIMAVFSGFFLLCAVLGCLVLARSVHVAHGWSWLTIVRSIRHGLGPA